MSFGQIQFGGLASGLDTGAIISALLSLESRPLHTLAQQKSAESNRISLFGTLEGLVEKLQEKARTLTTGAGFFAHAITGADGPGAAVTLTGGDVATGSHTLRVLALAAADRYAFDGIADDTTQLGAGSVSFDYGGESYTVTVSNAAATLHEVAAAINDQAGDAVTASVVNAGTEQSPSYQLVIAGDDTGADFTIDSLATSYGAQIGLGQQIATASNAVVEIDGLTVQRSSNVFDDVLGGISFTVNQVTSEAITFSVDVDTEGTKENVRGFVDAYNAVIDFINRQSSYSAESGAGGPLFGDPALNRVRRTISTALFDVDLGTVQADTQGFSTLGLIGIDLENDGRLSIDDAKLDAKMAADIDAVARLFTDPDSGRLVELEDAISALVDSADAPDGSRLPGLFDGRREALNDRIEDIDDQIERLELHLEQFETTLIQRFANLEQIMAGLNAQSAYLTQSLSTFSR